MHPLIGLARTTLIGMPCASCMTASTPQAVNTIVAGTDRRSSLRSAQGLDPVHPWHLPDQDHQIKGRAGLLGLHHHLQCRGAGPGRGHADLPAGEDFLLHLQGDGAVIHDQNAQRPDPRKGQDRLDLVGLPHGKGQAKGKGAAPALIAFGADPAAHVLDDLSTDGQP